MEGAASPVASLVASISEAGQQGEGHFSDPDMVMH